MIKRFISMYSCCMRTHGHAHAICMHMHCNLELFRSVPLKFFQSLRACMLKLRPSVKALNKILCYLISETSQELRNKTLMHPS